MVSSQRAPAKWNALANPPTFGAQWACKEGLSRGAVKVPVSVSNGALHRAQAAPASRGRYWLCLPGLRGAGAAPSAAATGRWQMLKISASLAEAARVLIQPMIFES